MNELFWWMVGAALAMIFTYAILVDAIVSWKWARKDGDKDLIKEGWRCVRNQAIASITQTIMVIIGILAYASFHLELIIWGLVAIPWTINLRVFLDFYDRKRFFRWKRKQKEEEQWFHH